MMRHYTALVKSLSPALMSKALRTFDRVTLLVVGISWAVTIAIMLLALYTIHLSVVAKKEAETALVAEPVLPLVKRTPVGGKEIQVMVERLQRRYPEINVAFTNNAFTLDASNGSKYHTWLAALGQVDTLNPQFHWKIKEMCVGSMCGNQPLMSISMVGEKVAFETPSKDDKK